MQKELRVHIENIIDWLLHFISYAIILVFVATYFDSFKIDDTHLYLYGLLATLIIFILNKTNKPIIYRITKPITGLTQAIYNPYINEVNIKLTERILRSHFEIHGIWTVFFIAILISIMNILIENIIITPIMRRIKKNG